MRVRKDPEVRQSELIDAALELFIAVGYEKTMVVDIVKKVGVAKGTFFYYFPTKEAVLEAICTRWAAEMATSYQLKSRNHTAINKLQTFISELLLPSQVDVLIDRLWDEKQFNLVYQEGTMHVDYIKETIAFYWSTIDCLLEVAYSKEPQETYRIKTKIAESVLERILGIEEGMLELSIP